MTAPTIVYDLDGTLADTAGDLMGALNAVLTHEGLAPLPVENARSMLGAGGRALLARGFAASGRELTPLEARSPVRRFSRPLQCPHRDRDPPLSRRATRRSTPSLRPAGVQAICTNKMEGSAKTPDGDGSASPIGSPSSAARTRSASASRTRSRSSARSRRPAGS